MPRHVSRIRNSRTQCFCPSQSCVCRGTRRDPCARRRRRFYPSQSWVCRGTDPIALSEPCTCFYPSQSWVCRGTSDPRDGCSRSEVSIPARAGCAAAPRNRGLARLENWVSIPARAGCAAALSAFRQPSDDIKFLSQPELGVPRHSASRTMKNARPFLSQPELGVPRHSSRSHPSVRSSFYPSQSWVCRGTSRASAGSCGSLFLSQPELGVPRHSCSCR